MTGKIRSKEEFGEATDVDGIYVVGDALLGAPELTPTAIMSGINVAKQVYNSVTGTESSKINKLNYKFTPTTIFSYPEYSACGYTEAEAVKIFGENEINVFHSITTPLEENLKLDDAEKVKSYFKLVCNGLENKVVGMHYLGLNAGEIMQGFAVSKTQIFPLIFRQRLSSAALKMT